MLKIIRERHGITIEALSNDLGYDKSYISKVERYIKPPSKEYVDAFMNYFGIEKDMQPFKKFIKEQKEIAMKNIEEKYYA